MLYADLKDGELVNRRDDGCEKKPQRCLICKRRIDSRLDLSFRCVCEVSQPDDGCTCKLAEWHYDLTPGVPRVVVDVWPDDGSGPWSYDAATKTAIPNAVKTRESREERLIESFRRKRDAEGAREVLIAAGASTTAMDARVAAESSILRGLAKKLA